MTESLREQPRPVDAEGRETDFDGALLEYLQTLSPAQRLERHEGALELVRVLRAAGREFYGFDPRAVASLGE